MNLEGILLSEVSETEKTSNVWFHLYMESKKQNEWTNKIEIRISVIKKNLVADRGEGRRG